MPWQLLGGLSVPAILVRPDGSIALANPAAEAFFNASQQQLLERGWSVALGPDSIVERLVQRSLSDGSSQAAYDIDVVFPGGRTVKADILTSPAAEAPDWMTVAFQTRSVASLAGRQMHQRGAARSAVGVAAMLAHEIKNPLSGIRGAAQLLGRRRSPDAQELTDLIVAEVDRIAKLVDRMESFTDTRPVHRQSENIHEILGHARQVAATGFGRGLTISERYDPSLPPVHANRDAMVQVILNLLKNAAEATGDGGEIVITTSYRTGFRIRTGADQSVSLPIEVRIMDNGPGIEPGLVDHVFEPFVTTKAQGTGLGLALVAKVVADHGGIIEYERARNPAMTIFRILLPMALPREPQS
ncbi:ATP-binding protein [Sandarakinorhabdus sp.]|uniref:two-component system sensor histidine kinase NtrB n=1 Tax=Sandarakinorhabdus sp. TaxID=1916663 RepID=UPI00286E472C|nr:ATP-binding protein [Sandarakinorhabdus sp.]